MGGEDEVYLVRKLITRPNWAVIRLLSDGVPRTNRQIYKALGKRFTRKTLISSLRTLALELKVLAPQHIAGVAGYEVGYALPEDMRVLVKDLERLQKLVGKLSKE